MTVGDATSCTLVGMRLSVVLNGQAGALKGLAGWEAEDLVHGWFRDAGADPTVKATAPAQLLEAIDRALRADPDAVIVGGGDGTIRAAAGLLIDRGIPLGILPLGTVNLLAHTLGSPDDPEQAARALVRGQSRLIDVAEVNGHIFMNNAVLGLYPSLARARERRRTRSLLAQAWGVLRGLIMAVRYRNSITVALSAPGMKAEHHRTNSLAITNNPYREGHATPLGTRALDEGCLGVYIAKHRTGWALLRLAAAFMLRRWQRDPQMERYTMTSLHVTSRRRRLTVSLDGEVVRLSPPLLFRCRPGALRVLVPVCEEGHSAP